MALQAHVNTGILSGWYALFEAFDKLTAAGRSPVVRMREPWTIRAHRAGAGVYPPSAHLARQRQRGLKSAHGLPPPSLVGVDQVLPVAGDLVQLHSFVGQQVSQSLRLVGRRVVWIIASEARKDP